MAWVSWYADPGKMNEKEAELHFKVRWAIVRAADEEKLLIKVSDFNVPYDGSGYPALAAAHSQALGELSREIAGEVKRIYENEH